MKKISWFWIGICSVIIIITFVSWQQFGKLTPDAELLTEKDAINLVQQRYQGKVSNIKFTGQQYHIEIEKQNRLYFLKLDAENGKVLVFEQTGTAIPEPSTPQKIELTEEAVKKIILSVTNGTIVSLEKIDNNQKPFYKAIVNEAEKQTTLTIDAVSGTILSSATTTINSPSKNMSEAEVAQIALNQIQGEVEKIWLETENEQTYYLVEIKTQEDREAIVQIHAITGEVESVTWDDRKDKEKNDDDNKVED